MRTGPKQGAAGDTGISNRMGLPLWSAPLAEEPAHGLMLRLAEINGYRTIQPVFEETGLSSARLHRGEQLDRLAALVRRPLETIAADSFHLGDDGHVTIRGHRLNFKQDYALQHRRACPACLRESDHHRFPWDLCFMTTCPRHGLKLERTCACGSGRKLGWLDARVHRGRCCRTGDLRQIPGEAGEPDVVATDAYFAGRLGVGPRIEIAALDELALCDVAEVLDRVGALALHGYNKRWQTSRKAGQPGSPAMAVGYRIIEEGRLQETLDAVYKGFLARPDHPPPSLTVAYGWFYHWYNLKGNSRFSRYLTEEIYRHAARRFRIDRKAMRNKSIVVSDATNALMDAFDRQRSTLSDASRQCGCHLIQLRHLAVAYGLMREEKLTGRVVLLERDDVEVLRLAIKRMIPKSHVCKVVNAAPRFVNRLEVEGVLEPVLQAQRDGVRVTKFLIDDVHDLLGLFERNSVREVVDGPSLSAKYALRWYSLRAIVTEMRAGRLKPYLAEPTGRGMARYRFRRADMKACFRTDSDAPCATPPPDIERLRAKIGRLGIGAA